MGRRRTRRAAEFARLGALLVVVSVRPVQAPHTTEMMMNETNVQAAEMLNLADGDYFAFGQQQASAMQLRLSSLTAQDPFSRPLSIDPDADGTPPLLAIGAPKKIAPSEGGALPLLVANQRTGLDEWRAGFDQNARAVIVDLGTGALRTEQLVGSHKRQSPPAPSMSGAPPDAINALAVTSTVRRFDLDRRLSGRDGYSARVALTVVVFDRVSNTVVVELEGKPREDASAVHASNFLRPGGGAPPADAGVALALSGGVAPGEAFPVHVSVNLARERVVTVPGVGETSPLLKVALLLVKRDDAMPAQIDLSVPVEGEAADVKTVFSFDLQTAFPEFGAKEEYQAYVIVGRETSGPYRIFSAP